MDSFFLHHQSGFESREMPSTVMYEVTSSFTSCKVGLGLTMADFLTGGGDDPDASGSVLPGDELAPVVSVA